MADQIEYVYAVVDADTSFTAPPSGLDDAAVRLERAGGVGALVSSLDAATYSPAAIEAMTADIDWLGPRARAHDQVITWASARGAVAPLPMFSMFRDPARVRAMLDERRAELAGILDRVRGRDEYGVRVFRIDDLLAERLAELSPRIAELERTAASASPGQRYLLERKLDAERRSEVQQVGAAVGQTVYDALAPHADAAVLDELPRRTPEDVAGTAVLNAAFLMRRESTEPFRRELTRLVREHEERGFRFEFTGPWPPYHFARGAVSDAK